MKFIFHFICSKECGILLTMKEVRVKLTSKNQITLPVKIVRDMHMGSSRYFYIRKNSRKNVYELVPEPSFEERMADIWKETAKYIKRPLSDEELKNATREVFANRKFK